MTHHPERYHSLDFLRAAMMFLGIVLHGVLSFPETRIPFWPAWDVDRSPVADFLIFVIHAFRMQTFFLLAGFFGCLLAERSGLWGLLKHRFARIVIPFGLALIIIQPILQALWMLGNRDALRAVGMPFDPDLPRAQMLEEHFLSGRFLGSIDPFHLWFLYFLIVFFLLIVPPMLLIRGRAAGYGRRLFRGLLQLRGRSIVLALITMPFLWTMQLEGMVDTPNRWELPPNLLGYYFLFFAVGWLLWHDRDLLPTIGRRWPWGLALGNLVVLPVFLILMFARLDVMQQKSPPLGVGPTALLCFSAALFTWLMLIGLIGMFQTCFTRERHWVRWAADASYWCYLWHMVPIIALQILLEQSPLPGLLKFAIIIGVSLALLLTSYQWGVRYTAIGRLLNGRRARPLPPHDNEPRP